MSQKPNNETSGEEGSGITKELEMLRKLAIFYFIDRGYSQADIGKLLGLSQPTISRMFPDGLPKRKNSSDE